MQKNNLKTFDLDLKKKTNMNFIAAMDEVARGSMCGPFVAACVILPDDYYNTEINDSKKLNNTQLKKFNQEIIENSIFYKIIEYDNEQIDEIGIQKINTMAFIDLKKIMETNFEKVLYLTDGNIMKNYNDFLSFEKGDSKSFSIACASIIAKNYRDECMVHLAKKYPFWNLEANKGYGVDYINCVKKYGYPEKIHRHSFKIKNMNQLKLF